MKVIFAALFLSMPSHAGWDMSFNDEFSGSLVNDQKWIKTLRWGDRTLTGNAELQCYMEDNLSVASGVLAIEARKQTLVCPKINTTYNYTSGVITSFGKFSQTYGYFEMRAQLPAGKGFWPAFWMLTDSGVWPPEIDIMENLGDNPTRMYMTYHYTNSGHKSSSAYIDLAHTGYHTYGVDWQPGLLIWYIDGIEVRRFASTFVPKEPMYLLANLAVGGYWPGSPTSSTIFPSKMSIDYIRAYERINNGLAHTVPPFGKGVSVGVTSPLNGGVVQPSTYVTISARPVNAGVVSIFVNGVKICEKNVAPYNCSYKTPSSAASLQIKAFAVASGGASATAISNVTVGTPPTIKIVSPTSTSVLKTSFWTTLTGSTSNAVKVEYFVNGIPHCTVTKSPFNCSYRTPSVPGTVELKAVATSSAGLQASTVTRFSVVAP